MRCVFLSTGILTQCLLFSDSICLQFFGAFATVNSKLCPWFMYLIIYIFVVLFVYFAYFKIVFLFSYYTVRSLKCCHWFDFYLTEPNTSKAGGSPGSLIGVSSSSGGDVLRLFWGQCCALNALTWHLPKSWTLNFWPHGCQGEQIKEAPHWIMGKVTLAYSAVQFSQTVSHCSGYVPYISYAGICKKTPCYDQSVENNRNTSCSLISLKSHSK